METTPQDSFEEPQPLAEERHEHSYDVPPLTGLAVASLVLGIVSMLAAILLIPGVFAIITGHLAIHKIRHTHKDLGGHKLAVTGLIMGYVSILLFSVTMLAAFFLWPRVGPVVKDYFSERKERVSLRQASELFLVCERFALGHDDKYPTDWKELEKGYSNSIDLKEWLSSSHTTDPAYYPCFELLNHERPVFGTAKGRVAVIQERAPPSVGQVVVVFADGHSELSPNPARE
jgi:hypothetical protein